ncbi:2OG-Fe(II) oxygenase [Aliiroseovarius subalbicans]|uniref:prolyl hydroxylase family protein n=1 Tax=Aliiroseovarius subalbicans TaxID=2925840 RepID=UPI001F55E9AD|nr:2OG-Fe(II) oxygenase [Aliiroseovarius subalbicans]MCI2398749.1 2OG-Fe(II) oxygenase [Aliiroseovarius subalbicans]
MTNIQIHCLNPLVATADDVFDADFAKHAIETGQKAGLGRAKIAAGDSGIESRARTNSHAGIDPWSDPVFTAFVEQISDLVRLPPENCEPATLLHYQGEEEFKPHQDGFDPGGFSSPHLLNGGQRVFTCLCYLNDPPSGGHTTFPQLQLTVRPKLGRVLIFANTLPASDAIHPHAQHAGEPVKEGEKWALTLWWREAAYHVPRSYPPQEGPMREV